MLGAWPVTQKPPFSRPYSARVHVLVQTVSNSRLTCVFVFSPLRALLLGLASNHNLKGVSLDLSNCEVRAHLDCALEEIIMASKLALSFSRRKCDTVIPEGVSEAEKRTF